MTDRDRLINELKKAKNRCLIHESGGCLACKYRGQADCVLENLADHLLENGVMCPPCKVGDMVWWVAKLIDKNCEGKLNIEIGEVDSFLIRSDGLWAHCCYESGLAYRHLVAANFGKTIFLTKEEAEAKLKELIEIDA